MNKLTHMLGILVVVVVSCASVHAAASNFDYLHEHPGTTTATVSGSHKALNKEDSAAFKRNLERLYAMLVKQPVLAAPIWVKIKGYFRPNDYQPMSSKVPIAGFG